jgi:hypothetical protein
MGSATGKRVVRLPPAAARLVGSEATEEEQLAALRGEISLPFQETCTIICLLVGSRSPLVRDAALRALRSVNPDDLAELLADPELHPRFLDLIGRVHAGNAVVAELVIWHPAVLESTRDYLVSRQAGQATTNNTAGISETDEETGTEDEPESAGATGPVAEIEEDVFRTAYQRAQHLGIGEKIKMALTGDKEWRTILIKDTIKPICCAVLKNPRITEAEILAIARSAVQYDDIIRLICANREWLKKYPIRKALVENQRTPLPVALKLLATLGEKDLSFLAKNKNISTVLSTQARKMSLAKKQK